MNSFTITVRDESQLIGTAINYNSRIPEKDCSLFEELQSGLGYRNVFAYISMWHESSVGYSILLGLIE